MPLALRRLGACFVTLECDHALRGCIGSLVAERSLADDVARNAYASAFEDPRFAPLAHGEFGRLEISLSVLSAPEPLTVQSEKDLVDQLQPGVDGVVLTEGGCRGTFLPSVWASLPEPREFVQHLKRKAGFEPDYWSATIRFERYVTESWRESDL